MRGIWRGIGSKPNTIHFVQDVQYGVEHADYPYHPAREAKGDVLASEGCLFFLNGMRCGIGDLKPGDKIEVEGKPAVAVRAKRSE